MFKVWILTMKNLDGNSLTFTEVICEFKVSYDT